MSLLPLFLLLMMPQLAGVGVVFAADRGGRRWLRVFAPTATSLTFLVTSLSFLGARLLDGRTGYGAYGIVLSATVLGVLMHWTISSAALAGSATARRRPQFRRERADGLG